MNTNEISYLLPFHNFMQTCNRGQRWIIETQHSELISVFLMLCHIWGPERHFYVFHAVCNVKDGQVTSPLFFFYFLWRTMARYESPNSMLPHCHGFKEIGSLFVCRAASIQIPHKERETRRGLRESSLCKVEGKGWIKKIALVHQFSLIPTGTINVSERWAIYGRLRHKQAFSSFCLCDELAGPGVIKLIEGLAIRWQSG